jgi:rhodanese-related sulfurtransferase
MGVRRLILTAVSQAAIVVALALVPALGSAFFHPKKPSWIRPASTEIDLKTAARWGKNTLWVDARPRAEFERGHIPGAVLLNEEEWERQIDAFLDAWRHDLKVVVYCSSASCDASHEVASRLKTEAPQIMNVFVLKGGWETWRTSQK